MPRKSSIKTLPPEILNAVNGALNDGRTIDDVVALIRSMGKARSRSAVGRYKKQIDAVADKMRQAREMATVLVGEIGPNAPEGKTGRLLVEILQNITFNFLLREAEEDDAAADARDLHFLARAIKDMASAQKIDVEREAKIRRDQAEKAADEVDRIALAEGLSKETVDKFRAGILGLTK